MQLLGDSDAEGDALGGSSDGSFPDGTASGSRGSTSIGFAEPAPIPTAPLAADHFLTGWIGPDFGAPPAYQQIKEEDEQEEDGSEEDGSEEEPEEQKRAAPRQRRSRNANKTEQERLEQMERIKKRRRESAQRSRARKNCYVKNLEVRGGLLA